jgi:hypothetical protein
MLLTLQPQAPGRTTGSESHANLVSPSLDWLWSYLRDVPKPSVLDCGPVRRTTTEVLFRRGVKLYIGDLITSLLRGDPDFWDRTRKTPVFKTDDLLAQLPPIPPGSISAVLSWQLLDLLPHEALAAVVLQFYVYLKRGGVLFCILREPNLKEGVEAGWWLEDLRTLGRDGEGARPFPHPALTNREIERLIPTGNIKTFLTRSGRREILAIK